MRKRRRRRRRIDRLKILLFFDVVFHCSVFIMGTHSLSLSPFFLPSGLLLSFLFSDPIQIADSW